MMTMNQENLQDILKKRQEIQVTRVFRAEYLGAGRIRYTCLTCGASKVKDLRTEGLSDAAVKRVVASHHRQPPRGICSRCTRRERDARFPLAN